MTYDQFDEAMMYVWAVFLPILAAFVVWGVVALIQERWRRRHTLARLDQTLQRRDSSEIEAAHGTEPGALERRQ